MRASIETVTWVSGPLAIGVLPHDLSLSLEQALMKRSEAHDSVEWLSYSGRAADGLTTWLCLRRAWEGLETSRSPRAEAADGSTRVPEASAGYTTGDLVVLGRHIEIEGELNWSPDMDQFAGRLAVVLFTAQEKPGCTVAKVDIDGGRFWWRVQNMRTVRSPEGLAALRVEIIRRLAIVYARYGADEAELEFLQRLHAAGALETRLRLRLTHLLASSDDAERRERARDMLVERTGSRWMVVPPPESLIAPGDIGRAQALSEAASQLLDLDRPVDLLRLLSDHADVVDEQGHPAEYANKIASALAQLSEEPPDARPPSPHVTFLEWWEELFERGLDGARWSSRSVLALTRSAALLSDRARIWKLLERVFARPGLERDILLAGLAPLFTEFGLLPERAACRVIGAAGSDSFELLIAEGRVLKEAGICPPVLARLILSAVLDALEAKAGFLHLDGERTELLELARAELPVVPADDRAQLEGRLAVLSGDHARAWELLASSEQAVSSPSAHAGMVESWYRAFGSSVAWRLHPSCLESLPERIKSSSAVAMVFDLAFADSRFGRTLEDDQAVDEVLSMLARSAVRERTTARVEVIMHAGAVHESAGRQASDAGRHDRAILLWKTALSLWMSAIESSIEREAPFASTLPRQARLLRELVELRCRALQRHLRAEQARSESSD